MPPNNSPFDLPELLPHEKEQLVQLLNSNAGTLLLKWVDRLAAKALANLTSVETDHRYHQGVYKGITVLHTSAREARAIEASKGQIAKATGRKG